MDEQSEPARPLSVAFPVPMIAAVDAYARRCGLRRSAAFRELLVSALTTRGLWPPTFADATSSDRSDAR